MSRVGKQPIKLDKSTKANLSGRILKVEGPKGKLEHRVPEQILVKIEKESIVLSVGSEASKEDRALWGTTRSVVQNMVSGTAQEFQKELDIIGVGYRAAVKGKVLSLTLGFSHPVDFDLPEGVAAKVDKNTHVVLTSANKILLGQVAATLRGIKPPEPYQGKGIRYTNEHIIRKQGKAAATGTK